MLIEMPICAGNEVLLCVGRFQTKQASVKVGDLEFGDVDDLEDELNDVQLQPTSKTAQRKQVKQLDSKPIDTHAAIVSFSVYLPDSGSTYAVIRILHTSHKIGVCSLSHG